MRQLLQRLNPFKKKTTQAQPSPNTQELAQFSQHIHDVCDSVEVKNLTLVSNTIESTSGHNNHHLVKAAVYFVKECVWLFNKEYASQYHKTDYFDEFVIYVKEVQNNFEKHHYDPDGVGGGTITDIVIKVGEISLA